MIPSSPRDGDRVVSPPVVAGRPTRPSLQGRASCTAALETEEPSSPRNGDSPRSAAPASPRSASWAAAAGSQQSREPRKLGGMLGGQRSAPPLAVDKYPLPLKALDDFAPSHAAPSAAASAGDIPPPQGPPPPNFAEADIPPPTTPPPPLAPKNDAAPPPYAPNTAIQALKDEARAVTPISPCEAPELAAASPALCSLGSPPLSPAQAQRTALAAQKAPDSPRRAPDSPRGQEEIVSLTKIANHMRRMSVAPPRESVREENDAPLPLADTPPTGENCIMNRGKKLAPPPQTKYAEVKICMLGAQWTGKSRLVVRLLYDVFEEDNDPTVEDNYTTPWQVHNETLTLSILDTSGDSSFDSMHKKWIGWADCFVMCYSCTNVDTFDVLPKLIREVLNIKGKDSHFVIAATHCDAPQAERKVTSKEGRSIAKRFHCTYFEVSSKLGLFRDISAPFECLVKAIRTNAPPNLSDTDAILSGHISLNGKKRYVELLPGRLAVYKNEHKLKAPLYLPLVTTSVKPLASKKTALELWCTAQKLTVVFSSVADLERWRDAVLAQISAELNAMMCEKSKKLNVGEATPEELWTELKRASPANSRCADCGANDPDWTAINLGVLICIQCSGVHRSLGVHISKVRSLTLDLLDSHTFTFLKSVGNATANAIWEANMPKGAKPQPTDPRAAKERFIRDKYGARRYVDLAVTPRERLPEVLAHAVTGGDLPAVLRALALGADVAYVYPAGERTVLHIACEQGNLSVVIALVNAAMCQNVEKSLVAQKDAAGATPLQVASAAKTAAAAKSEIAAYLSSV